MSTLLNKPCRISSPNLIRRNIFCHNRSSPNNGSFPYCYSITDNNINANEHIILNVHLSKAKFISLFFRIKVMSQYFYSCCYSHMITNIYFIWSYRVNTNSIID